MVRSLAYYSFIRQNNFGGSNERTRSHEFSRSGNVRREIAVMLKLWHAFAQARTLAGVPT
jgi:hypothetical protein